MTDREAVHLLNRVNRRHALLNPDPSIPLREEQIAMWCHELEIGLAALTNAGYELTFVTDPPRPRYVMHEPAEALPLSR